MDVMDIENEGLFRNALLSGMNLFLGAGFSLSASSISPIDQAQVPLPSGNQLRDELVSYFSKPQYSKLQLPQLSHILSSQFRDQFHDYLTKRCTVTSFHPSYRNLHNVAVRKVFTTNIDNLIHEIYKDNTSHFIHDVDLHGASVLDAAAIPYYALHGGVVNGKEYIFTPTEIASAFAGNQDNWHLFRHEVRTTDTLFWGYNLDDADVLQAIASHQAGIGGANKWILVYNADEATSAYFRSLGFQIISGDTLGMLAYLGGVKAVDAVGAGPSAGELFPEYRIPRPSDVPQRPIASFFRGMAPTWSDIYSPNIHMLAVNKRVLDAILLDKNVVIVGLPLSGKTTLLMQIAALLDTKRQKIFVDSLTVESAKFIVRKVSASGAKAVVFVDNFVDSVDAVVELIANGVQVVGTDRTYVFDSISFRFTSKQLSVINITDITNADIQNIYDTIPVDIRRKNIATHYRDTEGMYVFDVIESNVRLPRLRERFRGVLKDIGGKDQSVLNLLVMMSYVHECRTPVSYDMIYIFIDKKGKSYGDADELVRRLHELVVEYDDGVIDADQYYYSPRSSAVASAIVEVCPSEVFKEAFARFHDVISPMVVPRYDVFRRYAYDAKYVAKAYPNWNEGKAFYERLVRRTDNPYDWQHAALYLAEKHEYAEAFRWIDVAISKSGSRIFSIRNSHAKILFDANIPFARASGDAVRLDLDRSMDTLKACYDNDRRKAYHATRYAEQAMQYHRVYADDKSLKYLELAQTWLAEQEAATTWNTQVPRLLREVRRKLGG